MKDYQAALEKLRNDAAEAALIRELATDTAKRVSSAEALFARKAAEVGNGDGLMLIDREQKKVVRSVGSSDPKKTTAWFGR